VRAAILVRGASALAFACGLGCAADRSADGERAEARAGAADDLRATPRQRGAVIGGEKVARAIAWPGPDRIDGSVRAELPSDVRDAIASSPVPVLVPRDHPDAQVFVGDTWVAVSAHGEGYAIHVQGSAQARVWPHVRAVERTHPVRGADGFVGRNDGIWTFSWIEHGAAYSATIECDARVADWCDDEASATTYVESLALVGGREVAP
jgi:hypothetical protein